MLLLSLPGCLCVLQKGGMPALFSGVGPRTVRTAVAYCILLTSYEVAKGVASDGAPSLSLFSLPSPQVDGVEP